MNVEIQHQNDYTSIRHLRKSARDLIDRLSPVDTEKIWYTGFTAVLDTYIYDKWLAPMTLNDTHQRLCGSVTQNNPIFYVRRLLYVTIQKHFGIKICIKFPGLIQKILLEVFGFYLWCRKFMIYICRLITNHKHAPFLYRRMQHQIPTYRKILQERDNERRC